jgi:hypothetical protein
MSGPIFISYRRDDAPHLAGRLYDRLAARFPKDRIFIDVDNLDPGVDFVEAIERTVGACDVLIAVIGRRWLISSEAEGSRRLDYPDDFVRLEVATALKRNIRVIPVLVDDASMPGASDVPDDLKALVRRHAIPISYDRFNADSARLIVVLERIFEKTTAERLERATKEHPWVNSLGMKFVPVAGTQVFFSVWDTRVQDFEAFVSDTNHDATGGMWSLKDEREPGATWRKPGFSQGLTHPVVGVSWNDAKKFCEWLTRREQGSGMLPRGRIYRLPTDAEWSAGVGLQGEEGTNPKEKDRKIKRYPWGEEWPPPAGAGNYAGQEAKTGDWPSGRSIIEGYNDGYARTSPVGSFAANASGLYDMGGNVWQWCEDCYSATVQSRVMRGASWSSRDPGTPLASYRGSASPDYRYNRVGFRCVVAAESSRWG